MTQTVQVISPSILLNDKIVGQPNVTVLKLDFSSAEVQTINADFLQVLINGQVVATVRIK